MLTGGSLNLSNNESVNCAAPVRQTGVSSPTGHPAKRQAYGYSPDCGLHARWVIKFKAAEGKHLTTSDC